MAVTSRTTMEDRRADAGRRFGIGDVLYFVSLAVYATGALVVLLQGVGTVVAATADGIHETLHVQGLGTGAWARVAERMADASHAVGSPLSVGLDYTFSAFNLALAGFLIWLRPTDRTARMLAIGLVGAAGIFNLTAQSTLEQLPMTSAESALQAAAHIVAGIAYAYALLLFPDGRLVPRWRPWATVMLYVPLTLGAVLLTARVQGPARPIVLLLFFGLLTPTAGVAAQAYRFSRPASPAAHQQARLLFWALLPPLVVGVVSVVLAGAPDLSGFAGRHLPRQSVILFRVFQPVFALIPAALFAGILRYRLWDIDRVINRTIVYGAVTATLVGGYLAIVVLLQRLFAPITRESDLAVAMSTLAVAVAARPLHGRVQRFVDRRFYRHRYDAAETIEAFAARLREEIDLDAMTSALRNVVMDTMQPDQVSMWLRRPDGSLGWSWTHRKPGSSSDRNGSVTADR